MKDFTLLAVLECNMLVLFYYSLSSYILPQMSPASFSTLRFLLAHLIKVAALSEENRMQVHVLTKKGTPYYCKILQLQGRLQQSCLKLK